MKTSLKKNESRDTRPRNEKIDRHCEEAGPTIRLREQILHTGRRSNLVNQLPRIITLIVALLAAPQLRAEDATLALIPASITLDYAGAFHGLTLERANGGLYLGDLSHDATFTSSDPAVATVDALGGVRAIANGDATITATANGASATATVHVSGADQPFERSFRNHVQPVLYKMGCNTGACHGAAAGKNGLKLSLRGYDPEWDHKMLTRQANGRRVSPAEPEQSLMLLKPTMAVPHEGGLRFETDSEAYAILLDWIRAGAPSAREDDVRVNRIETFPKLATLENAATQRILVRAHYTDGKYEDVTRWAKFDTTDESVATVEPLGLVTVQGPGAASISVWYSSRVASSELTVPRATPVPADRFAAAQRNTFIDDLILQQLEALQIAPAENANDATFIRRAYLDTIGVLPTSEETAAFVASEEAGKREKLIDALLDRPEFVDYWTYKWSDLLLLSSRNLGGPDLQSFYRYIRESVAANKPWDAFATEILTAKGDTRSGGPANYFAMHKEITDLTETTSLTFLGMSITCARCHNHPLEKWTQDDYYGMANLFARVKLKNSEDGGIDVVPAQFGDLVHPRLGRPMPPRPLDGVALAANFTGDRREELARWMTSPENPYFTRALVNRVWKNFMGRGLVEPVDDLRLSNPASNEALMAALADDVAKHGYDLKHLIREIMRSAAYQRSSMPSDPREPDGKYYSQYIVRRLNAEVILDAYSQVTEIPTAFGGYPAGFRALQLPDSQVSSYFLSAFGRPQRIQTCSCERTEASSVAQVLHVANGDTLNDKLRNEKSFLAKFITDAAPNDAVLDALYLRALARHPADAEKSDALALLNESPADSPETRREALEDLAWAVLSSKEFLFNH